MHCTKLAKLLTTRKNTSTSLNEKFKIRNLSFQNRYSPGSCFLGVFSGAPRACSARSGAPWVRKTSVITWPYFRPTVRPSAPQVYRCKIAQLTSIATKMQLEVILAGNRIASLVLWSRDRSLAETTKELIKTKTESGNYLCILVV